MATVYSKQRLKDNMFARRLDISLESLIASHVRTYRTGKIWRQKSPFVYISGIFHILNSNLWRIL